MKRACASALCVTYVTPGTGVAIYAFLPFLSNHFNRAFTRLLVARQIDTVVSRYTGFGAVFGDPGFANPVLVALVTNGTWILVIALSGDLDFVYTLPRRRVAAVRRADVVIVTVGGHSLANSSRVAGGVPDAQIVQIARLPGRDKIEDTRLAEFASRHRALILTTDLFTIQVIPAVTHVSPGTTAVRTITTDDSWDVFFLLDGCVFRACRRCAAGGGQQRDCKDCEHSETTGILCHVFPPKKIFYLLSSAGPVSLPIGLWRKAKVTVIRKGQNPPKC